MGRSGVYSFAFSADSGKMATVSKDGSWKVFDTAIQFSRGQDAEVLVTGSYPWDSNQPSLISLSPDGLVVAIAQDKNLAFFSATTGECTGKMSEPHTEAVTSMIFDSSSAFLITAGDKHVRVFHNVPGKLMQIEDLKAQLKRNLSNSTPRQELRVSSGMQRRSYQPSQTKHRQGAGAEEVEFNGHGGHELLLSVINMKLSYLLFASNPTELICNLHHLKRAPSCVVPTVQE